MGSRCQPWYCGAIVYVAVKMAMKNSLMFEIVEKVRNKKMFDMYFVTFYSLVEYSCSSKSQIRKFGNRGSSARKSPFCA